MQLPQCSTAAGAICKWGIKAQRYARKRILYCAESWNSCSNKKIQQYLQEIMDVMESVCLHFFTSLYIKHHQVKYISTRWASKILTKTCLCVPVCACVCLWMPLLHTCSYNVAMMIMDGGSAWEAVWSMSSVSLPRHWQARLDYD